MNRTIQFLGGEIRLDQAGQPDDLVFGVDGTPIVAHIERMASDHIWIGLDDDRGNHLRLGFTSASPISFTAETEPVDEHGISRGGVSLGFDADGNAEAPLADYDPTEDSEPYGAGAEL